MKWFLLISFCFTLTACSPLVRYHGNETPDKKLSRLIVGQSDKKKTLALLGSPQHVSLDNNRLWIYISKETEAWLPTFENERSRRVVALYFNPKGLMVRKRILTLAQGQELAFAHRTSRSPIPELNWVQRLFSNIGRVAPSNLPQ